MWMLLAIIIGNSVKITPQAGQIYHTKTECEAVAKSHVPDINKSSFTFATSKNYFVCIQAEELK